MTKLTELLKKNVVPVILLLLTLFLIFPFFGKDFRISFGEGPFALNPNYLNFFYIWQDRINLGNILLFQALIFWFKIVWKLFEPFSFILQPSLSYIFIGGYFGAGLFLYFCLKKIFPYKNELIYLPPVLLYTFNIYRIIAGNSDETTILFICLPIFFYLYYRLLESLRWRYVFWLIIISILTSTMGKNLAVISIPYVLMLLYALFNIPFIIKYKQDKLFKFIALHTVLVLFTLCSSLFWVVPQYYLLQSYYLAADQGKNIWSVLGSGTFFDHFRLLGFWAFRDDKYFPYSPLYYKPFLLFTTYIVSLIALSYFFFLKDKKAFHLKLFFALLTIVTYLLVSGNKGVTGFFYQFLYEHISVVKMYRDSWAKFTPLYLFSMSGGLMFSLFYAFNFFRSRLLQGIIIIVLSAVIIINALPTFFVTYNTKPKEPPHAVSNLVQIPQYWKDLNQYLNRRQLDQWILVFQNNSYGTYSNWAYGANVVGNIAEFILNARVIRSYSLDISDAQQVINNIFKENYSIKNLKNYLGILNSRYILQENDTEWRFSDLVLPPKQSNEVIMQKGFVKVAEFGKFTPEYLKSIANTDTDPLKRQLLYTELTNQPALILYKMEDSFFVPMFYTPKKIIVSPKRVNDLDSMTSQPDYVIPSAIFLTRQNATPYAYNYFKGIQEDSPVTERPVIEYKEINPTKYRVVIHGAKKEFPLIFSSNFSSGWDIFPVKLDNSEINKQVLQSYAIIRGNENEQATRDELREYINKRWISALSGNPVFVSRNFQNTIQNNNLSDGTFYETWFKKPADNKNHLTANGYANSWIISPENYCSNGTCHKNPDGSYDFQFILEFSLQKYLFAGIALTFGILIFSVLFLITDYIRNHGRQV